MVKIAEEKFEQLKINNKDFVIIDGLKKIVISCPHSVEQFRNGQVKFSEPKTATIGLLLNQKGYPCFIKTTNENNDANYDEKSTYRDNLLSFAKTNDIKFVLDIHQLRQTRPMDICLCTGGDEDKNLCGKKNLLDIFYANLSDYVVTKNNPYSATGKNNISSFLARNQIPAMQLEINSKLLSDNNDLIKLTNIINLILEQILQETI